MNKRGCIGQDTRRVKILNVSVHMITGHTGQNDSIGQPPPTVHEPLEKEIYIKKTEAAAFLKHLRGNGIKTNQIDV